MEKLKIEEQVLEIPEIKKTPKRNMLKNPLLITFAIGILIYGGVYGELGYKIAEGFHDKYNLTKRKIESLKFSPLTKYSTMHGRYLYYLAQNM